MGVPAVRNCDDESKVLVLMGDGRLAHRGSDSLCALLIRRVPYYGINISAPYIVMRHWDEWNEKKTFKIDKKDIALCQLVMDIQHYSQKMYFGKFAEMYFDEKRKDDLASIVHRRRKTDSYFNLLL